MERQNQSQPDIMKTTLVVCFLLAARCLTHSSGAPRVEEPAQNTLAFRLRSLLDPIQNPTLPEAAQVESTGSGHTACLILALSVISCITSGKLFSLSLNFLMSQMGMALIASPPVLPSTSWDLGILSKLGVSPGAAIPPDPVGNLTTWGSWCPGTACL